MGLLYHSHGHEHKDDIYIANNNILIFTSGLHTTVQLHAHLNSLVVFFSPVNVFWQKQVLAVFSLSLSLLCILYLSNLYLIFAHYVRISKVSV